jgi:hypothetical protein
LYKFQAKSKKSKKSKKKKRKKKKKKIAVRDIGGPDRSSHYLSRLFIEQL